MNINKKNIIDRLKNVPDPELGISIVDLGLVYDVKIDKGNVRVIMTLTTMGCPLFDLIERPIKEELKKMKEVKNIDVELTFEPPWSPEKMSKQARINLGFF
ncbi:metal-sulfur cluster assembly factor [Candidatus Gottesmanbacteria bacterium]|nr:metal-sulfur cluster assembly factor [Candidatus Gottesmanbacteria bacterium]